MRNQKVLRNIPATNIIRKEISSGNNIDLYENAKQGLAYGWHRYAGPKTPKGEITGEFTNK